MTDLADRKFLIQQEETDFDSATSEAVMQRMGSMNNFLANRENTQHSFNLNGRYNIKSTPYYFGDGFLCYPWPWEIVDFMLFSGDSVGSGGTTEIGARWKPDVGGAWATIFSTTPKFTATASALESIRIGQTKTGFTAPVLSKTTFAAYDRVVIDVLQAMTGLPYGAYVKVFVRPRDPV